MAGDIRKLWVLMSKNLSDEVRAHIELEGSSSDTKPQQTTEQLLENLFEEVVYYSNEPSNLVQDLENLSCRQREARARQAVLAQEIENAKVQFQKCNTNISEKARERQMSQEEIRCCEAAVQKYEENCQNLEDTIRELKDQVQRAEERLVGLRFSCYSKRRERLEVQLGKRGMPDMLARMDREATECEKEVKDTESYVRQLKDSVVQKEKQINENRFERDGLQKRILELTSSIDVSLQEQKELETQLQTIGASAGLLLEQRVKWSKSEGLSGKLILKLMFITSLLAADKDQELRIQAVDMDVDNIM